MKRSGWLLAVLALFVASGGCETRDRSNPLDPYNNETGGLIDGFNALAGNRQVEIRWSRVKQNGLLGYRLLRWLPGDTPAVLEDHIASNLTGTVDTAVVNEESYVYQVVAHFQSGDTLASRIAAQYQGAATNIQVASLVYLALILLLISLITNFTAQLIVRRFDLERTGVA